MNLVKIRRDDLKNALKSAFDDLNGRVDKVEHAPNRDQCIEELTSKLELTERSRVRLASMINIRDYRIEGMAAQINKLLNAICERDQRIEELSSENNTLKKVIDEKADVVGVYYTRLVKLGKEFVELQSELDECRQAKQLLQEIVDTQASHIAKLRDDASGDGVDLITWKKRERELLQMVVERDIDLKELGFLIDCRDIEIVDDNIRREKKNKRIAELEHRIEELGSVNIGLQKEMCKRDATITKLKTGAWMMHVEGDFVDAIRYSSFSNVHKPANHALAIALRSHECVRTENRKLSSRVEELEAELNDMSREMSNRCVCSDPTEAQRLKLLDDIEKIVNPIIKSGDYAHPAESARVLAQAMWDLCHRIIDFRRKHNIVG